MYKAIPVIVALLFVAACGGQQPGPQRAQAKEDPRLTAIKEKIARTNDEGKQMVEKALAMKPKVNDQVSGMTLGEHINDYAKNKAEYSIIPIGWEASQKSNKRWKLIYHYQDFTKAFQSAEWEYNPETNELYPFEFKNAPTFWTAGPQDAKAGKAAGKK